MDRLPKPFLITFNLCCFMQSAQEETMDFKPIGNRTDSSFYQEETAVRFCQCDFTSFSVFN